jgi:hypothetical protein
MLGSYIEKDILFGLAFLLVFFAVIIVQDSYEERLVEDIIPSCFWMCAGFMLPFWMCRKAALERFQRTDSSGAAQQVPGGDAERRSTPQV